MKLRERIKNFKESDNFWTGLFRDFLSVLMVFVMISSLSRALRTGDYRKVRKKS